MGFLFGVMKRSGIRQWGSVRNTVNILKPTELHSLNGWTLWYVNISIELLYLKNDWTKSYGDTSVQGPGSITVPATGQPAVKKKKRIVCSNEETISFPTTKSLQQPVVKSNPKRGENKRAYNLQFPGRYEMELTKDCTKENVYQNCSLPFDYTDLNKSKSFLTHEKMCQLLY